MSIFEALLQHDRVPNFYRVENTRSAPKLEDVAAETRRVMQESGTLEQLKPGQSVCIAAGSREIARWFERQRAEDVGGFLPAALKAESAILDEYRRSFAEIEARYSASADLRNERVIKNHAQVAACGCALSILFPVFDQQWRAGLEAYLLGRAIERERRLLADHPLLEQFWDQFDYLNGMAAEKGKADRLNHATDEALIAVNLNHFMELSRSAGQPVFDTQALKKLFPNCKRHKFVENKVIWSKHENRAYKCWVFKKSS